MPAAVYSGGGHTQASPYHQPDHLTQGSPGDDDSMASAVIAMMGTRGDGQGHSGGCDIGTKYIRVIYEVFKRLDADGVGSLGQVQLQQLWRAVLPGMPDNDLIRLSDEIYQDLDPNHDGHVSWPEVEAYFLGGCDTRAGTGEVDKMISETIIEAEPTMRQNIWACVEAESPRFTKQPEWVSAVKRVVSLISNITILASIINFIVESLPEQYVEDEDVSTSSGPYIVEATCIGIFTVEFLVRWAFCPKQRAYWFSFFTWVDVLAIFPFYLTVAMGSNPSGALVVLRVLRLLRLLRMLKLGRQFESVHVLVIAVGRTIYPLMVSMIGVNLVAVTLFASLIVTAERDQTSFDKTQQKWIRNADADYDDAGQPIDFQSIPASMWWAWVTLTTVGYGDMYPRTGAGQAIASVAMCVGLVLMAFPLTLLASAFAETTEELRAKKLTRARGEAFKTKLREFGLSPNATQETIDEAVKRATGRHEYGYLQVGGAIHSRGLFFRGNEFQPPSLVRTASGAGLQVPQSPTAKYGVENDTADQGATGNSSAHERAPTGSTSNQGNSPAVHPMQPAQGAGNGAVFDSIQEPPAEGPQPAIPGSVPPPAATGPGSPSGRQPRLTVGYQRHSRGSDSTVHLRSPVHSAPPALPRPPPDAPVEQRVAWQEQMLELLQVQMQYLTQTIARIDDRTRGTELASPRVVHYHGRPNPRRSVLLDSSEQQRLGALFSDS